MRLTSGRQSWLGWKGLGATVVAGALALATLGGASAQVNRAPTAVPDSAVTAEDTSVVIAVLANDTDPDAGTVLKVTQVGKPANGQAIYNGANRTVTYTPKANFHGVDFFTYTISDGALSASATVVVTVTPVNDAPQAKPDSANVTRNTPKTIDVLANDSDVEGSPLVIVAVSSPSHGTAAITGGKIVYTPATNYTGGDAFTYTVSDGSLISTGTVTVSVKAGGSNGGNVDQQVKRACERRGNDSDVRSLCRVYLGGKLPAGAQQAIGQVILRKTSMPARAAQICSTGGLDASVQQLCGVYNDSSVSGSVRWVLGRIIEHSVRS